jgi:Rieske Fe-S protein
MVPIFSRNFAAATDLPVVRGIGAPAIFSSGGAEVWMLFKGFCTHLLCASRFRPVKARRMMVSGTQQMTDAGNE